MTEPLPGIRSYSDLLAFEKDHHLAQTLPAAHVYGLFERAADRWGDSAALAFLARGERGEAPKVMSHRELFGNITRTANALYRLGVGSTDAVSILLPMLPEAHEASWGAETAGISNPINFLLRAEEIAALLRAAQAKVLIALGPHPQLDIWPKSLEIAAEVPSLEAVLRVSVGGPDPSGDIDAIERPGSVGAPVPVLDFRQLRDAEPGDRLLSDRQIEPDDVAAYFHTGGTTGAPKLARHTHRNQVTSAWAAATYCRFDADDTVVNGLPLFHVAGAIAAGLAPLHTGARVLIPTAAGMRHPSVVANFWHLMDEHGVTVLSGVPTSMAAVSQVPLGQADLSKARMAITGASPLPPEVGRRFEAVSGVRLHEMLGMTETAGFVASEPSGTETEHGCVGLRAPFLELEIRHHRQGEPSEGVCGPGESGLVLLRGPQVFPGYLDSGGDQGRLTEDGFLVTGDLGKVDEKGRLWLTGRAKDVIIRSGHNIDPALVEQSVDDHEGVDLAAAVGLPDIYAGEVPILYVTARPGETLDPEEVLRHAAERIAEPPARPREVVVIEELPLTTVGKPFRPELRRDAAQRAFESALSEIHGHTPLEVEARLDGGGLHLEIYPLEPPADPAAFETRVRSELDAFTLPYRVSLATK